jgi:hypothetical protein
MVRHFLLTVGDPAAARKLLGRLVSSDETDAPQIATAEEWQVGFEPGPGDITTELPRCIRSVHRRGRRASRVNRAIGPSAPENRVGGFGKGSDHVR